MNFDDVYMLKMSIRISDYEKASNLFKKVGKKISNDSEVVDCLSKYCTDLRIFNLFEQSSLFKNNDKIYNPQFFLILMKNPFSNESIIKYYLASNKMKIDGFYDTFEGSSQSALIKLLENTNNLKKLRVFEYLLNKDDFDFNKKNLKGETNSQILLSDNPTDMDAIFTEKVENLLKNKSKDNKNLFKGYTFHFSPFTPKSKSIEEEVNNFISEPIESYKINFADIEYKLLKLNIKLRRMYQSSITNLSNLDLNKDLSKIHEGVLEDIIFEKLLLEKI